MDLLIRIMEDIMHLTIILICLIILHLITLMGEERIPLRMGQAIQCTVDILLRHRLIIWAAHLQVLTLVITIPILRTIPA